jgi:hypothetical protein
MKLVKIITLLLFSLLTIHTQEMPDEACLDCHINGAWSPLSSTPNFNHSRQTDFPLVLSHQDLSCKQCHRGKSIEDFHLFKSNGLECSNCHQDMHQNYWGKQCEECHTPENWSPAQAFRKHDETLLPLIAGHHLNDCYACHTSPQTMPSLDCVSCHFANFADDLEAHDGVDANGDCSACHAPTNWNQILALNHDIFFPIYSGVHRWKWPSCSTCHTQAGVYNDFTCFGSGCHSVSNMYGRHCEGSGCESCNGFTYPRSGVTASDCLFCHPQGNKNTCGD